MQERIAQFQASALEDAWKKTGWTEDQVTVYLKSVDAEYNQLEKVKKQDFQNILKTFLKGPQAPQTSEQVLEMGKKSVDMAQAKKTKGTNWHAVAAAVGVPENDVYIFMKEQFGAPSATMLSPLQLNELIAWIKSVGVQK